MILRTVPDDADRVDLHLSISPPRLTLTGDLHLVLLSASAEHLPQALIGIAVLENKLEGLR